jgi:phage recombination protein Bet
MEAENNVTAISPVVSATRSMVRAIEFSPEQRKMIRDTFANGASDSEFAVLMEVARARNLNPLMRQIYFVKRWDSQKRCEVWSTQISIDGLRAVAERTGLYDGQSDPEYEYAQGSDASRPTKCTVRVYRKDWSSGRSASGVAFFEEYKQTKKDGTLTQFWASKPHIMIAKCAEALAIRKAFPEDTAGLYVPEEMGEAAAHTEARPDADAPRLPPKVEVLPPEPKPATPPPKTVPVTPPYVRTLWNRTVSVHGGSKELARKAFESAARAVFGEPPKPSNDWTEEDALNVESHIIPSDVP